MEIEYIGIDFKATKINSEFRGVLCNGPYEINRPYNSLVCYDILS